LAKALNVEVADFFREPAVPLAEAPQAGRPTIIDVAWDAARRQIARDRQADPRGMADDGPSNEAMRRLREEYGLGGNDAEALVDHMLKDARREENAKVPDRLQEREQAHS
jgi:hypothetical protein